jgi:hypothetical protein
MEIFKIESVNMTRSSAHDEKIEALFESYDKGEGNLIALKQEEEGSAQGLVQRIKNTYGDLLKERNVSVRLLAVSIRQKQLKDAGYVKMVVLAPNEQEEDGKDGDTEIQA